MPKQRKPVSTLTDFDIREVSLVDLAANKRRFLIAKRSEPMVDDENTETTESQDEPIVDGADQATPADPGQHASVDTNDSAKMTATLLESVRALQDAVTRLATDHATQREGTASAATPHDATVLKSMQQRLARLEKNVGQPTSTTVEPLRTPAAHVWPFDINSPVANGNEE